METGIRPLGGVELEGLGRCRPPGRQLPRLFSAAVLPHLGPLSHGSSVWGQHRGVGQWLMSLSPEVVRDTGWGGTAPLVHADRKAGPVTRDSRVADKGLWALSRGSGLLPKGPELCLPWVSCRGQPQSPSHQQLGPS